MLDLVITEFMEKGVVDDLARDFRLLYDPELWTKRPELERLVADIPVLIVRNRTRVDRALLAKAPRLKAIGRLGVGLDNFDMPACTEAGVEVMPAVGANAVSVAEYAVSLGTVLLRQAAYLSSARLASGEWPREELGLGLEAEGRTFGIVGFGSIGQITGAKAAAFGYKVIAHDAYVPPASEAWSRAERTGLDDLVARADVVSLHCPLTPETRGLFDSRRIAAMKKGAVLVNASRGGVVDEAACAAALRSGHLGGAALDVFDTEPITKAAGAVFAGIPNVILTPHIAGVTIEATERISQVTADNVRGAFARIRAGEKGRA